MYTQEEIGYLLKIARLSIISSLKNQSPPDYSDCPCSLLQKAGAFVTLHKFGDLRGCIGYLDGVKPLVETIVEVAPKSAFEDPRFLPVTEDEIEDLQIEISVLTPMKLIKNIDEIEVGNHGLMMERGNHRGLLLPQVATEYNWDRETFLNQTARKAGLSYNEWKRGDVKIYIFSAEIFNES